MNYRHLALILPLALAIPVAASADVRPGDAAPDFRLTDMHGKQVSLGAYKGKFVVLEWTNPECPFVRRHYNSGNMQGLQQRYTKRGVVWLSINSSALGREGYRTPATALATAKQQKSASTDVLLDPTGAVGMLYGARTTPHMYVINPAGRIAYMGGIDAVATSDAEVAPKADNFVSAALDATLAGRRVAVPAAMPYGCSVKYAVK